VKNSLRVLNRELGADFDLDAYSYVPFWDRRMQRMDLRLRAEMPQHVRIPGAQLELDLASGEEIRVEISTKFTEEGLRAELGAVGLAITGWWTDGDFAVVLARK
jgi:L-histidine N-alpha-methyltransferase